MYQVPAGIGSRRPLRPGVHSRIVTWTDITDQMMQNPVSRHWTDAAPGKQALNGHCAGKHTPNGRCAR